VIGFSSDRIDAWIAERIRNGEAERVAKVKR